MEGARVRRDFYSKALRWSTTPTERVAATKHLAFTLLHHGQEDEVSSGGCGGVGDDDDDDDDDDDGGGGGGGEGRMAGPYGWEK